ncbi:hypothetical protein D9M71_658230 [compost metagenome]
MALKFLIKHPHGHALKSIMMFYHCHFVEFFHDQSLRNVLYFLDYLQYCYVRFQGYTCLLQYQMQSLPNAIHYEYGVQLLHLSLKQRAQHQDNVHLTIGDIEPKFVVAHKSA